MSKGRETVGKSSINDIEHVINSYMRECVDDNEKELVRRAKDAGNRAAKELRRESRKRSGRYAKGWKSTEKTTVDGTEVVVYASRYQLTHLLENDHAVKNQTGRTYGTAKGDHVIAGVADRVGRQFASGGDGK